MKIRILRLLLQIVGASAVGLWVAYFLQPMALRVVGLGQVHFGAAARWHSWDPIVVSLPSLLGAAIAGVLVGLSADRVRPRLWSVVAVTIYLVMGYSYLFTSGEVFSGRIGLWTVLQALAVSGCFLVGSLICRRFGPNSAAA